MHRCKDNNKGIKYIKAKTYLAESNSKPIYLSTVQLHSKRSQFFHQAVCRLCCLVVLANDWEELEVKTDILAVLHVAIPVLSLPKNVYKTHFKLEKFFLTIAFRSFQEFYGMGEPWCKLEQLVFLD